MKNIISAFTTLFFYLLCVFGAAALLTASAQTAAAKEYKADVIAEIENSDFNRDVISSYDYKMPVFGIEKTHMTRGIAR